MVVATRRRRKRTDAEWAAIDVRLNALLAECRPDEDVGRRLAEAWLAGRTYAEPVEHAYCDVRCDGWSVFVADDCLATWQPGPRRLYHPHVALVSDRRLRAGSFEIRVRYGLASALEERSVPTVRLVPPSPCPYH